MNKEIFGCSIFVINRKFSKTPKFPVLQFSRLPFQLIIGPGVELIEIKLEAKISISYVSTDQRSDSPYKVPE